MPPTYTPTVTIVPSATATATVTVAPPSPSPSASSTAASAGDDDPSSATGNDGSDGRCTGDALGVSTAPGDDSEGSRFVQVLITNVGGEPCTLRGTPKVSVIRDGRTLGPAADRVTEGATTVELAVGGSAVAPVQVVDIEDDALEGCEVVRGDGYRVTVPGTGRQVDVEDTDAVACADGPSFMRAGPVEEG